MGGACEPHKRSLSTCEALRTKLAAVPCRVYRPISRSLEVGREGISIS